MLVLAAQLYHIVRPCTCMHKASLKTAKWVSMSRKFYIIFRSSFCLKSAKITSPLRRNICVNLGLNSRVVTHMKQPPHATFQLAPNSKYFARKNVLKTPSRENYLLYILLVIFH
jgi:hypothetical protein